MRVSFTNKNIYQVREFDSLIYNEATEEAIFYNEMNEYEKCIYVRLDIDRYFIMANQICENGYIHLNRQNYNYEVWQLK